MRCRQLQCRGQNSQRVIVGSQSGVVQLDVLQIALIKLKRELTTKKKPAKKIISGQRLFSLKAESACIR